MSAWVVSHTHIDALLTAACAWDLELPERATARGQQLLRVNARSVRARYGSARGARVKAYTFDPLPGHPDPEVVATAAASWCYQSCEFEGWKETDAAKFVGQLREIAEERLPEWVQRFGSVDPAVCVSHREWWALTDELGNRTVRCALGWNIDGRRTVFERAAELRRLTREKAAVS